MGPVVIAEHVGLQAVDMRPMSCLWVALIALLFVAVSVAAQLAAAVVAAPTENPATGSAAGLTTLIEIETRLSEEGVSEKLSLLYDFASDFSLAARGIIKTVKTRPTPGRDGATSAHIIERLDGDTQSVAFPGARGNPAAINRQAQDIVDDLLTTPGTSSATRHHARFGDVLEIRAPDGRGLRYGADGKFLGFLEPRP